MQVAPYLMFHGNCAEAVRFYEQALGAKVAFMQTFGESPMAEKTPPDWRDKVMHVSLKVGETVLMASDAWPGMSEPMQGFSVSLSIADPAEADRRFAALADGGTVKMAIQETFWAQRFGSVIDRFGTPWMVNCEKPAA